MILAKIPQIKLVLDRKGVADDYKNVNRKTKGLLQIEIYYKGQRKWISTGVKLYRGQWNEAKGGVINHPDASNKNAEIMQLVNTVNDNVRRQFDKNKEFSFALLDIEKETESSVLTALREAEAECKAMHKTRTWKKYLCIEKWLRDFGKIKVYADLNTENLEELQSQMVRTGLKPSTINLYMGILYSICERLRKKGKLPNNPCENINRVKKRETEIRYLNEKELAKMRNAKVRSSYQRYALDFFLVQTMTGLSYIDLYNLNIYKDCVKIDEKYIVRNTRRKTGTQFTIQIIQQAYDIIKRYGGQMNRITLETLNQHLHNIGNATLGKKVTSHMGRHTFATWALSHGVPIEYVSAMLGHTNVSTTQRYAKVLSEDVLKQFCKLEAALE